MILFVHFPQRILLRAEVNNERVACVNMLCHVLQLWFEGMGLDFVKVLTLAD